MDPTVVGIIGIVVLSGLACAPAAWTLAGAFLRRHRLARAFRHDGDSTHRVVRHFGSRLATVHRGEAAGGAEAGMRPVRTGLPGVGPVDGRGPLLCEIRLAACRRELAEKGKVLDELRFE